MYVKASSRSVDDVFNAVEAAAKAEGFGVLHTYDFRQVLAGAECLPIAGDQNTADQFIITRLQGILHFQGHVTVKAIEFIRPVQRNKSYSLFDPEVNNVHISVFNGT